MGNHFVARRHDSLWRNSNRTKVGRTPWSAAGPLASQPLPSRQPRRRFVWQPILAAAAFQAADTLTPDTPLGNPHG